MAFYIDIDKISATVDTQAGKGRLRLDKASGDVRDMPKRLLTEFMRSPITTRNRYSNSRHRRVMTVQAQCGEKMTVILSATLRILTTSGRPAWGLWRAVRALRAPAGWGKL